MKSFIANVLRSCVSSAGNCGKKITTYSFIIWLFITFSTIERASAQSKPYFHFSEQRNRKSFSFKFHRNLIVLDVKINGRGPFNFVLDTGVGVSTITDPSLKYLLDLQSERSVVIRGLGGEEGSPAFITSGVTISFNGIESVPLTIVVFEKDPFLLSTYLGIKVDGILGYKS
jgi:hypothetical protein